MDHMQPPTIRCLLYALPFLATSAWGQLKELPASVNEWGPYNETAVIIHAAELLAVPGEPPATQMSIVIEHGRVGDVREGYATASELGLADALVIDLTDRFVLPGLMDGHTHITSTPSPTFRLDRVVQSDAHRAIWGAYNAEVTLLAGFTSIRDTAGLRGNSFDHVFALRDGIKLGKVPGPRLLVAGQGIGSTASQGDFLGYRHDVMELLESRAMCSGPPACREAVRYQIKRGADFIKLAATGWATGPSEFGDQQHMFFDELEAAVQTAHLMGRRVTAHATGLDGVKAALRAGVDSVEHGRVLDDEAVQLFNESGTYLVPTLLVTKQFIADTDYVPGSANPIRTAEAQPLAPVAEQWFRSARLAYEGGVKFAYGTDSAITPHGDNAQEFAMLVEGVGMSPMEAIVTATVNAAENFGLSDEVGTIETGKAADIIAVASSPLDDITELERVRFVMRNGVVYKNE